MFPSKLFRIDHNTSTLVGLASVLGTIYGPSAVFEHIDEDVFGLRVSMNDGTVERFWLKDTLRHGERLTFVLEPFEGTRFHRLGYKMAIIAKEDVSDQKQSAPNRKAA